MVEWWELWTAWWSGRQVGQSQLVGWPVLYWGRLGKVLQFAAGLTVLLDLIGPDPLRAFGKRLTRVPWAKGFRRTSEVVAVVVFVVSLIAYAVFWVVSVLPDLIPPVSDLLVRRAPAEPVELGVWGPVLVFVAVCVFFGLIFLTHWLIYERGQARTPKSKAQLKDEATNAMFFVPVVAVAALLAGAVLLPWLVFIYGLCVPVSRGAAWLLDRGRPAHPLRWAALVLFVIGFQFDLLAS
ncbi:hypothetical protein [Lentzea sp. CA-135723]|uniref:hypothetical protein n=1 Tax=Lentzea sp. CA-135723 TaxID=3239950 RepID=UPI003D94F295